MNSFLNEYFMNKLNGDIRWKYVRYAILIYYFFF
jgi:hypothetical protein